MLPTPNLDDRSFEQIRDEAIRLIPQYCPEWTNFNPSDPGVTLLELFSWMTEMVLYRLNRVPEKVYLTLLDLIGVRLRPPQPARATLTFHLVEGCATGTWVPRGTQVATEPNEDGEAIVFETEEDLFAVPNRLVRVVSIHQDKVADNTDKLQAIPRQPFEAFAGATEIERFLYLSDPRLSTLAETGTVQLVFDCPKARTEGLTALLEWEYWNGHRWRELEPTEVSPEEAATSSRTQRAVAFAGPLEDLAEGEVAGLEGFWLRGRLIELPANDDETIVGAITASAQILTEGVLADEVLTRTTGDMFVPLDGTRTFLPFGEQPAPDTCFYIQSEECLGKEDSRVLIDLVAAEPTLYPPARPTQNLVMVYEFWNGSRWTELGRATPAGVPENVGHEFRDTTLGLRQTGIISFLRPKDMAPCDVNGREGHWIRARIAQGDFGRPGRYEVVEGNWVWREDDPLAPPAFRALSLRYSQVPYPIARCITYNDFNYTDRSDLARDGARSFQPFEPFREEHPALYLGFDAPLPDKPMKLYLRVGELDDDTTDVVVDEPFPEEASERKKREKRLKPSQRTIWEIWTGERWVDVKPRDDTRGMTRSGLLEVSGAADSKPRREFGQELHWLRCRLEMGSYAKGPVLEDILVNSVAAINAVEVKNETLAHSDGTPDQQHAFARFPVLPGEQVLVREPDLPTKRDLRKILQEEGDDAVLVERDEAGNATEVWVRWHRVESFYASGSTDRHYVIDPVAGKVIFGDGRRGMIPPPGPNAIMAQSYMTGGGVVGNVGAGSLTIMRQAIPYVERVTNYYKARGGVDMESIEEAKLRGPQVLRHRYRAVTVEDYEWLAVRASGSVARARCLKTPRREGEVTVIVIPKGEERTRDLKKKPVPAPELLRRVQDFLDERRLVTTRVRVTKPRFKELSLNVTVVLKHGGPAMDRLKRQLEDAIRNALHPLFGGPDGAGWPFGRAVHKSDIYRVVEGVDGVDFVEELELYDEDLKRTTVQLELGEDELVHVVDVEVRQLTKETLA